MRHLDTGRGTLALLAHNTAQMGQTRAQGWEMLGKGLAQVGQSGIQLWQLNAQERQRQKNNAFRETQALEEQEHRNKVFAEQKRQFGLRHNLDEKNSAVDRAYKNASIAMAKSNLKGGDSFNWELAEALKRKYIENPDTLSLQEQNYLKSAGFDTNDKNNGIALKTRALHESITNTDKLLRNASELYDKADAIKGTWYGVRRGLNRASLGFIGLNKEQNEFLTETTNLVDAFIKERYANQTSQFKEQKARELLDEALSSPEQFKARLGALSRDVLNQQIERTNTLREFGMSNDYAKRLQEKNDFYFKKFGKTKEQKSNPQLWQGYYKPPTK